MTQSKSVGQSQNALHELGYKIFLDRYALKDMTRQTLAVGDTVIVVVDSKTGQREVGEITALDLPKITVRLLDGSEVTRDIEHVDKPIETAPEQMMDRVARGIAEAEKTPEKQSEWQQKFRWLLDGWKFIPGGRILTGAGTDQELTYYNCYVIPSPRDSRGGIIETLRQMTEIMSRGGGVGINISSLRPRHAYVKGVNGRSSGSVSWGALYSFVTGLIEQGGCFGPDERIATNLGLIPAKELADRIEAGEAIYAHTHKGLRRITAKFRNGIKPLYEVKTARGYSVKITEDHKVAVLMDGQITTMPLKYLQPNDEILLLLDPSEAQNPLTLPEMQRDASVQVQEAVASAKVLELDSITSITPLGDSDVYDFEVDDVHLLSGNGVYTSNSRRGALMLILNDWHPDVFDFINSKRQMGQITNANISVGVSDKLMEAVKADADWTLMFPDTSDPDYDEAWDGDLDKWIADGRKVLPYRTVKAAELWNAMIESAWASAEPGVWFRERSNKMANSWYFNPLISTNPCVTGETLVSTEHGYTPARDLQVGMKIRTPAGLKPIEKIYNNGVQKIYRVTLSDGGFIDATADHKLKVVRKKRYEWIAVSDLNIGDKVLVMPNESFGSCRRLPDDALKYIDARGLKVSDYFDRDIGFLMGVVLGDGTLRQIGYSNSYSNVCKIAFGAGEPEWLTHIEQKIEGMGIHTHKTTAQKDIAYPNGTVATHQAITMDCYKLGTLLIKLGMEANTKAPEKSINPEFMSLDREFLAGLLDGLFSTDGGIDSSKANPMLRFHTSSFELAQQVRLLLLQFGIHGRVYKAKRKKDLMYDGRSMYGTGVKYDVLVMNEGIPRFYSEIGLSHPEKMRKLRDIAENTYFMGGTWLADVRSVEDTGREEEVFDVYEPDTVTWVTNGYVSFDCGEQPLGAFSVCNLGAIHLGKFYNAETRDVAWDDLRDAVRYAVRFLDNVIDSTPYFFEENARIQGMERRVGLGTMGIAELMVKLGVRYGSEESLKLIDDVYKLIAVEAYSMSAQIAAEKGAFPAFDAEKFLQSGYMQGMPEEVRELIQKYGIRNVTLLTQAPTGTTGTMANTSTGVEPFFSWVYYRKSRLGLHEEQVPLVKAWREQNPDATELPDYFVTAMELSPDEHVRVQAAFQRWVDSAISKTANVPNHYTVEQVSDLYKYMYELGCKGGTIYRDGSRDEQVLMLKGDERAESEMEKVKARQDKTDAAPDDDDTDAPASPHRVFPRPVKLTGVTANCPTPFGTAYVTMNVDEHGYPFEVFITAPGKAGSDLQADAEGLGRMISLSLRTTEPHNRREMLKLIIEQLRDIGGSRAVGFGPNRVISLPDSVARALEDHFFTIDQPQQLSLPMGNGNGQHTPHEMPPVSQALNGTAHDSHEASGMMSGADLCPSCGTISLIRAEGCRKCLTCGYSEC